jgi:hypothetical protein
MNITELEKNTIDIFWRTHALKGFPHPSKVEVLCRVNTGAGRRVALRSDVLMSGFTGYLDMEGRFIEMEGVDGGIMATISVDDGALSELEFSVYGNCTWDGEERPWRIMGGENP